MGGASVTSEETSPSIAAIVAAGDPALAEHRAVTSPDGMMTIAFTDIEGSTAMLEQLGEGQWLELIREHNRIVREVVSDYRGEVVKSQGDGFMVVFASASAALTCAVELQRRLAQHNERNPGRQLRVRIGLHTGNVFAAEHDFLGKAVLLAARITGRARVGEILVSGACREYTHRLGRWRYRGPRELRLKGIGTIERIYALEWAHA
jgi:class 3 adenylate cyclase